MERSDERLSTRDLASGADERDAEPQRDVLVSEHEETGTHRPGPWIVRTGPR